MSNPNVQKHTLHLRKNDFDFLTEVYKPNGVSASAVIRQLVSRHVDQIREHHEKSSAIEDLDD